MSSTAGAGADAGTDLGLCAGAAATAESGGWTVIVSCDVCGADRGAGTCVTSMGCGAEADDGIESQRGRGGGAAAVVALGTVEVEEMSCKRCVADGCSAEELLS
jgi:hypothetical protein